MDNDKFSFDSDQFVQSRPSKLRPMMNTFLHSQAFTEFIEDRLTQLNSGVTPNDIFETAVEAKFDDSASSEHNKVFYGLHTA